MKTMVTGGTGFLAGHLIDRLLNDGHEVRTLDLPESGVEKLGKSGVEVVECDLRDPEAVTRACRGMEVVFHVAALAAPFGPRELFWGINVIGTENVITGCRAGGVKRLVHVSSPSSVFDGTDHVDADESLPYPKKFISHYCETKAVSEQRALAANGPDLETVAIRPHAIWGPRDRNLLPRIISRAKAGRMFQIGDGTNIISTLYVKNGVDALMLASGAEAAPGKVYFITNDEPVRVWDFIKRILDHLDLPGPRGTLPYPAAYALGAAMEAAWTFLRLKGEPTLTRYTVAELAKNHSYSIARARKDLGYEPKVGVEQGLEKTFAWIDENGIPEYK
jgi:nucleoside-diphosphate-sugar epimerase